MPGCVAGRDRAVGREGRPQPGHVVCAHLRPDVLVRVDGDGALAAWHLDRDDLVAEVARLLRGRGATVALRRQRVLVGARDAEVSGHVLRRHAHVAGIERIGERAHHRVDHRPVLHPLAPAHARQPVLTAAHGFGSARHRQVTVAERDGLRRRDDRLQAAAAQPVEGQRRRPDRQAAVDRRHPGQVHVPDLGVDDVAEYRVPEVLGGGAGPADRLAHHRGRQVTRRHRGQAAAVLADRGTNRRQHEDVALAERVVVSHRHSPHMSSPPLTAQIWPVM